MQVGETFEASSQEAGGFALFSFSPGWSKAAWLVSKQILHTFNL